MKLRTRKTKLRQHSTSIQIGPFPSLCIGIHYLVLQYITPNYFSVPRAQQNPSAWGYIALCYSDVFNGPVISISFCFAYPVYNLDSLGNPAKYCMLAIQPLSRCQGDEELASISVWTTVGHGQDASTWKRVIYRERKRQRDRRRERERERERERQTDRQTDTVKLLFHDGTTGSWNSRGLNWELGFLPVCLSSFVTSSSNCLP